MLQIEDKTAVKDAEVVQKVPQGLRYAEEDPPPRDRLREIPTSFTMPNHTLCRYSFRHSDSITTY